MAGILKFKKMGGGLSVHFRQNTGLLASVFGGPSNTPKILGFTLFKFVDWQYSLVTYYTP